MTVKMCAKFSIPIQPIQHEVRKLGGTDWGSSSFFDMSYGMSALGPLAWQGRLRVSPSEREKRNTQPEQPIDLLGMADAIRRLEPWSPQGALAVDGVEWRKERHAYIAASAQRHAEEMGVKFQAHAAIGRLVEEVAGFVNDKKVDLLVVGPIKCSHLESMFLGDPVFRLIRAVPCACIVLRWAPSC